MVAPVRTEGQMAGLRCPICSVEFQTALSFSDHKATAAHRIKWLKQWYQNNRLLLAQNKHGVEVYPSQGQSGVHYQSRSGTLSVSLPPGGEQSFSLVIKNTGHDPVILRQVEMLHSCRLVAFSDHYGVTQGERLVRILADIEYKVECQVQGGSLGVEQVPVAFQFQPDLSDDLFFIVRTVEVNVLDSVAKAAAEGPTYKHTVAPASFRAHTKNVVEGVPIQKDVTMSGMQNVVELGACYSPKNLRHLATKNFNHKKVLPEHVKEAKQYKKMMEVGLTAATHQRWYDTQLWLEELQMEVDIKYYSMREATLKRVPATVYNRATCVELQVPGLAEKRPSVLRGDNVFVVLKGKRAPVYAGVVHVVNDGSLYLAFNAEFMRTFINNMKVSVEFEFNRHSLKVSHRALELGQTQVVQALTFPSLPRISPAPLPNILPFNRQMEKNKEQMKAVRSIVGGTSRPAPYVIFGPPGTGKTVTVVEAIKQVHRQLANSRVLACAPSNAAADIIAQRLLEHIPRKEIFRMHAKSRPENTIPQPLKEISNLQDGHMYYPDLTELGRYRVIVCTLVTAARLVSGGMANGHMTHLFLDECGQAMEPEALVALAGMVSTESQVVLAGDPHQLGPVIRNTQCFSSEKLFSGRGLDKSLLERLMELDMYKPVPNSPVVTKLLNNYRSHQAILKKSNDIFYQSELKMCADPAYVNSFCQWEELPKKNFPLIFHGVRGKDQREGKSPSFFNALEVSQVIYYVKKLLESRKPKVTGKEIGIITPYRRQVEKLRTEVRKVRGAEGVQVGSPEEFQGDERRVVIISTVRASTNQLADDQVFKLGFLRNPKRFNVAVTRAKALLIVVGCPEILILDENWGQLLEYIRSCGGYRGPTFSSSSDEDLDEILQRFENLSLRPVLGEDPSTLEQAEAPQWHTEY